MMSKPRVLMTREFLKPGDEVDRILQEAGFETVFKLWDGRRSEDETIELLKGMDAIIAGMDLLTARVINSTDRLKVIVRTGVGVETVDVKAATAKGIGVCNAAGVNRHAVSEFTIALMLQCARKMMENLSEVRKGSWGRHEGMDLAGKTLGILGLGTIGKEVAQRMHAFEMRILAYDVRPDPQFAEAYGVSFVPLEQLLRESDLVTIHAFLDACTRHTINAERLALMKPTAYLINTSRGGLVDTAALVQALRERKIAGAALDVFEEEPLGESPLRELDNVYLSPHAAGTSRDPRVHQRIIAAENVIRFLRGERPLHIVNPEVLDRR